jgi:hypothetical protein
MKKFHDNHIQDLKYELCELRSNPLHNKNLVDYFEEILQGHELLEHYDYHSIKICFAEALINLEIEEK